MVFSAPLYTWCYKDAGMISQQFLQVDGLSATKRSNSISPLLYKRLSAYKLVELETSSRFRGFNDKLAQLTEDTRHHLGLLKDQLGLRTAVPSLHAFVLGPTWNSGAFEGSEYLKACLAQATNYNIEILRPGAGGFSKCLNSSLMAQGGWISDSEYVTRLAAKAKQVEERPNDSRAWGAFA